MSQKTKNLNKKISFISIIGTFSLLVFTVFGLFYFNQPSTENKSAEASTSTFPDVPTFPTPPNNPPLPSTTKPFFIESTEINLNPSKEASKIYGKEPLNIGIKPNHPYIKEGAECKFYIKNYFANNSQWNTSTSNYTASEGCNAIFPASLQTYGWVDIQIRAKNPETGIYSNLLFYSISTQLN